MAVKSPLRRYAITFGALRASVKEYRQSRAMRAIVHRDGSVSITCPPGTPKMEVGRFVEQSAGWIRGAVARMLGKPGTGSRYITEFRSQGHALEFQQHDKNFVESVISESKILVKYPKTLDICSAQVQQAAYKAIVAALKEEAAQFVPKRIKELASLNGLSFRSLTITSARSRWGSCSSAKDIRISCFVMMLPLRLIDLVLLHELAHTVFMSHSASFHARLNSMLPLRNEKELGKELRNYHITKPK